MFATAAAQEPASPIYWERTTVGSDYPFPFQFTRAQPPASGSKKAAGEPEQVEKMVKKPDATDAAIAAALANDPDVKMARAKMQLAEAEFAKARQAVTIKVVTLKAKIEQLKVQLGPVEQQLTVMMEAFKRGNGAYAEVLAVREKVEAAKAALALAETEWKLLTGSAPGVGLGTDSGHERTVASALLWLGKHQAAGNPDAAALLMQSLMASGAAQERAAVKGPVAERIRAALDKPVKLAEKGQFVNFQAAIDAFKKAGIDIPFRQNNALETITSEGEELPVGAWLQLFLDMNPGMVMVVREYGVLITLKENAPPDAVGVMDFWKQKPQAKEAKAESTTAPKK
jgi:hypothetical protein